MNNVNFKIDINDAMKKTIYIYTLLFLLCACGSSQKASQPADTRYQRKPLVEVSEDDLKLEVEQIDATIQRIVGKGTEAVEKYQKILKEKPDYAPAHYELGRIFLSMGWLDSALVHTQQAFKTNPNNYWYEYQLAKIYEQQQDGKNLTATWEDIVKRNPENIDRYYDLSNAYLMAGNVPASIEVLDRVESRFGISEPISLQKQKLWNAINKPDKARKEIEKLANAMPSEPRYNAIMAESYMKEKNYTKALTFYNHIFESSPNDENINISLAACYMAMNNVDMAFKHLRAGVTNPALECQNKLLFLTEFMKDRSFFAKYSKRCFLLADTIDSYCSNSLNHKLLYGQILAAQERYAEAADQFAAYIETDKSKYEAWEALLLCESMISDTNENLMKHAQQASELFPLHSRPYLTLAQGYLKLGDCEKARQMIERCLMVSPNDALAKQLHQTIINTCK